MAEKILLILLINAKCREHFLLQLRFVNSDATTTYLDTIQDYVVGISADLPKLAFIEQRQIFCLGPSERVMHRVPFVFFGVPLEEREIGDPKEIELGIDIS